MKGVLWGLERQGTSGSRFPAIWKWPGLCPHAHPLGKRLLRRPVPNSGPWPPTCHKVSAAVALASACCLFKITSPHSWEPLTGQKALRCIGISLLPPRA